MSTSRKIQIALGAILLWSSTSVSSFAATNTINPGKNQSDIVKLSVESIPSRQLNLTQDTKLIAFDFGQILRQMPGASDLTPKFEEAWKQSDRKQRILGLCNSPPSGVDVDGCYDIIHIWLMDKKDKAINSRNFSDEALFGSDFRDLMMAEPPSK